jgi:antitoxin MazE
MKIGQSEDSTSNPIFVLTWDNSEFFLDPPFILFILWINKEGAMRTTLKKWGNSQGLRFPKALLEKANLAIGDPVEIIADEGQIIIKASNIIRGKYKIKDLVAKMPKDHKPSEESWGAAVGKEQW